MFFEKKYIKEHLGKTLCYRCGSSLERAQIVPISEAPIALIAHAVCPKCQAESMVTITSTGSGSIPLVSDLTPEEVKDFLFPVDRTKRKKEVESYFLKKHGVSYDDLLNVYKMLEKDSIWNLLRKHEKNLEKKQKV